MLNMPYVPQECGVETPLCKYTTSMFQVTIFLDLQKGSSKDDDDDEKGVAKSVFYEKHW